MKLKYPGFRNLRLLPQNRRIVSTVAIAVAVLCLSVNNSYSQQGVESRTPKQFLRGKVTDESGKPLSDVTVKLKGTNRGVVTNVNGEYNLEVADKSNQILEFSYVGMATREVKFGNQAEMNISLSANSNEQDEVVVIGYGTQKKQAITGSVVQAKLKTYEKVATNNIMESVKGTIPGLNVGGTNTAGGLASFSIRGQNSINAGNSPLVVVDGAIFRGTLNDIAPSDIESFTVLKDASAAAVFGSRSANGVIIIETKKGSGVNGKPRFDINVSQGISNELKPLEVYDGPGYLQRLLDTRQAMGQVADPAQIAAYLQLEEAKNYNATPDHKPTLEDPYSLFRSTGNMLNATLSYSHKTDKTQYYISGNVINQKGVIVNDKYKHYSARVNLETNVTNWFKVGVKGYYSLKSYPGRTIYGTSGGGSSSSPYWFGPVQHQLYKHLFLHQPKPRYQQGGDL